MKFKILSNFHLTAQHHGTVDRDQPTIYYDFRGKAQGCYQAARALPRTLSLGSGSLRQSVIADNTLVDHIDIQLPPEGLPKQYMSALHKVHSPVHVTGIEVAAHKLHEGHCDQSFGREADIWTGTYQAAISSVFACLVGVELVAQDLAGSTRAFANVWPPGHHAEGVGRDSSADLAMGFCYFSNAAIAALYANELGLRTVVIDIDNHSGNGTRKALMQRDGLAMVDFVYCSPFDEARGGYLDGFYDADAKSVVGVAREFPYRHLDPKRGISPHPVYKADNILSLEFEGKEYSSGVKRVEPAASAEEILARYESIALSWLDNFDPDLVIWSIGLDSAADDPLGALGFSPATFYDVIRITIDRFPKSKVLGIMEGGYKPENWTKCLWPALHGLCHSPV